MPHGTYRELQRRWKALRGRDDCTVREVACVGVARTILCCELGDRGSPSVAIAAGVHGDEPAGLWALLQLLERGGLDPAFSYRLWPCMNPTGFDAGTRESAEGMDLNRTFGRGGGSPEASAILTANRDRKFVLSIDLHEDCDAVGFYCYEYGRGEIGRAVIAALDAHGLPIDPLTETFDTAGPLATARCIRERGRIVADHRSEATLLGGLSYSLAMARRSNTALTFETPSALPWETRLQMHALALQAAIAHAPRVA